MKKAKGSTWKPRRSTSKQAGTYGCKDSWCALKSLNGSLKIFLCVKWSRSLLTNTPLRVVKTEYTLLHKHCSTMHTMHQLLWKDDTCIINNRKWEVPKQTRHCHMALYVCMSCSPKTECPQINFSTPPWKDLIFLLRQHCSSFSLRTTTSKTTPERNSTTGAWAVKVPFPRPTILKELFHKDQSPKLNSHHLWEGLTAGGRRGRSGQSEGTETCHRKARGTKASIATPCPIDPWTGSSNANCYKPIFMWNVSVLSR